jgi:hypothetical protein
MKNEMSFLTLSMAPSGAFSPIASNPFAPITESVDPIFNPGVLDFYRGSYITNANDTVVDEWLTSSTGETKWHIDKGHLESYADTAVKLATAVATNNAACRLAPLRGAARPCMLVDVMNKGNLDFEFFNFKEGSSKSRNIGIQSELLAILQRKDPKNELYKIQIVDTAIGGYGIVALTEMLKSLHDTNENFVKQSWSIDIHLLHPTNGHENVSRMESVKGQTTSRFQVVLKRYPVPDLIVEDYDDALGFTLERHGSKYFAKPSVVPGKFLLKTNGVFSLIESENLSLTFDEFMCEAVTNSLLTDPNRELVGIVWQDYVSKS